MQESWRFSNEGSPSTQSALERVKHVFEEKGREMGIFLSYYFRSEGAVAENVSLASITPDNEHSGHLMVRFDLVHFNACLNIHEEGKESMRLTYRIAPETQELILTGPYWPEREPDGI